MRNPTTPAVAGQPRANSFEINRRVLGSDLSLAAKAVLLVILDHARHGASRCTASTRTIAREANITPRHVRNVLGDLAARRLITIERATGSKCSRHTIFVGPCIHQVGNSFPLRVHEGGTDFPEGGNRTSHEGGTGFPLNSQGRTKETPGPPIDRRAIDGPVEWDCGIDPRWARLFPGRPILS